ncbi:MAG: hypothetical protein BWY31_02593 [Lentisphaerae bacterium ADurb.Bin242]|nr:MAG: hypothetical protein BWY31_02593 [Lentisphaerae bacterium ADurb.Bin242]
MIIKIANQKLSVEAAESFINHILYYANFLAKKLECHDEYYRGASCAYHEVLHTIQHWGKQAEIFWNKDLAQWADDHLQCPSNAIPEKHSSLRIRIRSGNVTSAKLEQLIQDLFVSAKKAAEKYDVQSDFQQGVGQTYTEVLDSIHNWGIIENAGINCNLEQWAVKHLA